MLNIDTLIWVIPGMVGLRAYHKELLVKLPQPEGWVYLVSVVFFALPYYLLNLLTFAVLHLLIPAELIDHLAISVPTDLAILAISIFICHLFGCFVAILINNKERDASLDPFHDNCTQWREQLVFITLDSKRIYLGTLVDHTKDVRFEYTIKIIPIYSGYRSNNGKVIWDFNYPLEEDTVVEIVIPRSRIITFALWSESEKFENAPI